MANRKKGVIGTREKRAIKIMVVDGRLIKAYDKTGKLICKYTLGDEGALELLNLFKNKKGSIKVEHLTINFK